MKTTNFHKNHFRGDEFTYADAVKYIDDRTVRSVNLETPSEKAMKNWHQLKYEEAKRQADEINRRDIRLSAQDAIISFVVVAATFLSMVWVISNYSH